MEEIYKEVSEFVQEFANENDMDAKEAVRELESRIRMDFSNDVAQRVSFYLDMLMVLHTRRQQHKLLMTVMAKLLDDLITTEFTLSDAIKELKVEYKHLKKNNRLLF